MAIALFTMGWGLVPLVRVIIGLDDKLGGSYIWSVSFLIGGLMCGLTAMLLLVRRQPPISTYLNPSLEGQEQEVNTAALIHASGLLIFTGIPLANFLACYFLWVKTRARSQYLDYQGREAICFQISLYLYIMMALFLAYIIVGVLALSLILLFHLIATLMAITLTLAGKGFRYPANINIISRSPN